MQKISFLRIITFTLLSFILPMNSWATTPVINDFLSYITVEKDANLLVTENINITTDGQTIQHGIYRDFPTKRQIANGHFKNVSFKVLSAKLDGKPVEYSVKRFDNKARIYLGSSDTSLSAGTYTFSLTYTTSGQIGFFTDHDELYWNVTGNQWQYPITLAEAIVTLPDGAGASITGTTAYTGPVGSRAQNYHSIQEANHRLLFNTTAPLHAHEGLTIVVGWKKGFVTHPGWQQLLWQNILTSPAYQILLLGLIVLLLYYFYAWIRYKYLCAPKSLDKTIIPEYEPPPDFSPAELCYILDLEYDSTAFTATILNLAVKGFIKITETTKDKYILIKQSTKDNKLSETEKGIMKILFEHGDTFDPDVQTSAMREASAYENSALDSKFREKYYVGNKKYVLIGIVLSLVIGGITVILNQSLFPIALVTFFSAIFLGVSLSRITNILFSIMFLLIPFTVFIFITIGFIDTANISYPWIYMGLGFIIGICNIIFNYLLPYTTTLGQKLINHIKGFKLFLAATEEDPLNFRNPADATPQIFEKYLPYAIALGIDQKWSERFSKILTEQNYQPTWCNSTYRTMSTAAMIGVFSTSLNNAFDTAINPPSSGSDSSGSGFGDGGCSGGGGGGGGGGGW